LREFDEFVGSGGEVVVVAEVDFTFAWVMGWEYFRRFPGISRSVVQTERSP
jgi:hypothetical protein